MTALAAGTVAATATLAQIFPPATVLVLLGDQLSNSYQVAQLAQGNFAPQTVTVALFAGAIFPGFVLVLLYILYLYRRGGRDAGKVAGDRARSEGAAGFAAGGTARHRSRCAVCAYPRRARLHSRRHRDPHRGRIGRRGRRDFACYA
jgi:hypothetical protein